MAKTCASCKTVSESGEGYREYSSLEPGEYCPLCLRKRMARGGRLMVIVVPLAMILLWLLTKITPPKDVWLLWGMLNVYLVVIFQFLVIPPHELGHALAARLLGLEVFQISIGIGPLLWKGRFLGGRLELHRYPFDGHTLSLDDREQGFRLRRWIHVACGPMANLLLILAVLPFGSRLTELRTIGESWDPVKAFIGANVLMLIFNLFPRTTQSSLGPAATDGMQLLRIPFMKHEEVRKLLSLRYLAPANAALEENRNEDAIKLYREGLQKYPEALHLRHDLGVALLRTGVNEEARLEFQALLAEPKLDPTFRPLCLNNVAAADVILGRPDLLEEADRCSTEAMITMAWNLSIKGTRASVLVERGRLDEGIVLARQALDQQEHEKLKAWSAITLAVAYKRKGDDTEGRKYYDLAVKVGADGPRMQRLRELYETPIAHNNRPGGPL